MDFIEKGDIIMYDFVDFMRQHILYQDNCKSYILSMKLIKKPWTYTYEDDYMRNIDLFTVEVNLKGCIFKGISVLDYVEIDKNGLYRITFEYKSKHLITL